MFTAQKFVTIDTLEQGLALNKKRNNVVLGGGCWLRLGQRRLDTLIDLSGLGLDEITYNGEEVSLGAMVTLRQLEESPVLRELWGDYFAHAVEHIVGVQFRACATLGGSVAGRFGFSDVLTALMALDCQVELAQGGRMDIRDFARAGAGDDILTHVHIQRTERRAAYQSMRNAHTDLPTLTCAVSRQGEDYRLAVGARPYRAETLEQVTAENLDEKLDSLRYGENMRAGAAYRRHLAGVLARRGMAQLKEEQR